MTGLNPTTFNKSKRITKVGKQHWPSMKSVSKILAATGESLAEFVVLMGEENASGLSQRVPMIGYAQASDSGYFEEDGYPTGSGWDEVLFPQISDLHTFALEISGSSMEPIYRDGDAIFVSPGAGIRRGDRVVVKTREGEVIVEELSRQSARRIELISLNKGYTDHILNIEDIDWMARIVWASQ